MNIGLLCVGTLKEAYWRDAAAEYLKRLAPYAKVSVTELREARPASGSAADEAAAVMKEGDALLAALGDPSPQTFVIALDIKGRRMTSEALSETLSSLAVSGKGRAVFVIGGSLGLSEAVLARADMRLSFSDMTFPHQMMRVVLLEQVYRAFKIARGEAYHK